MMPPFAGSPLRNRRATGMKMAAIRMAAISSRLVLPGPVYRHSPGANPASSAADSSPTEQTSARHGGQPPASRRDRAMAGCLLPRGPSAKAPSMQTL